MIFSKYQGAGNDFILIDGMGERVELNEYQIQALCNRRMGVGADGIIIISTSDEADFMMQYFNSDGSSGMMCANGARCATLFAASKGYISDETTFIASDGIHKSVLLNDTTVSVSIPDVTELRKIGNNYFVDTGAPHLVCPVQKIQLKDLDVVAEGRKLRYSKQLEPKGANINFLQEEGEFDYSIRTYERGVENEVLACGTGVTAAAIALHFRNKKTEGEFKYFIESRAGILTVDFKYSSEKYEKIWLTGPAEKVYEGKIHLKDLSSIKHLPQVQDSI